MVYNYLEISKSLVGKQTLPFQNDLLKYLIFINLLIPTEFSIVVRNMNLVHISQTMNFRCFTSLGTDF